MTLIGLLHRGHQATPVGAVVGDGARPQRPTPPLGGGGGGRGRAHLLHDEFPHLHLDAAAGPGRLLPSRRTHQVLEAAIQIVAGHATEDSAACRRWEKLAPQ